jgi:hypothetical protein
MHRPRQRHRIGPHLNWERITHNAPSPPHQMASGLPAPRAARNQRPGQLCRTIRMTEKLSAIADHQVQASFELMF